MIALMLGGCVPSGKGMDDLPLNVQQEPTGDGEVRGEEENEREHLLA